MSSHYPPCDHGECRGASVCRFKQPRSTPASSRSSFSNCSEPKGFRTPSSRSQERLHLDSTSPVRQRNQKGGGSRHTNFSNQHEQIVGEDGRKKKRPLPKEKSHETSNSLGTVGHPLEVKALTSKEPVCLSGRDRALATRRRNAGERLNVGNPSNSKVHMGPVCSDRLLETEHSGVEENLEALSIREDTKKINTSTAVKKTMRPKSNSRGSYHSCELEFEAKVDRKLSSATFNARSEDAETRKRTESTQRRNISIESPNASSSGQIKVNKISRSGKRENKKVLESNKQLWTGNVLSQDNACISTEIECDSCLNFESTVNSSTCEVCARCECPNCPETGASTSTLMISDSENTQATPHRNIEINIEFQRNNTQSDTNSGEEDNGNAMYYYDCCKHYCWRSTCGRSHKVAPIRVTCLPNESE